MIGSGGFGVPAFDALHKKHERSIAAVITAAPRSSGRDGALSFRTFWINPAILLIASYGDEL
ncbi:MAG: hypothetical protein ACKO8J_05190, partial [Candidatus Limnocylindrus sp.]